MGLDADEAGASSGYESSVSAACSESSKSSIEQEGYISDDDAKMKVSLIHLSSLLFCS